MSLVARLVLRMKAFDRKVWPAHRVVISPEAVELLGKNNLVVADVGSADGPEESWLELRESTHFLTFEPNPRPRLPEAGNRTTNFPIGLWSNPCRRQLYLTRHTDSSTVMPINTPLFADYLVHDAMDVVGSSAIELDALDRLLAGRPELSPDYLKIDVEGADLEVLKGSTQALAKTVLGVKVETSYLELHVGAPLLWEIDAFMRQQGFVLFNLGRNHWIRNNQRHGFSSQPQLIWGDAIYFLGREKFLERLSAAAEPQRKVILAKFVLILLRYGVHDYAWDIIEAARAAGRVSTEFAAALQASVKASMDTSVWYFVKGGLGVLFALGVCVVSLPSAEARKRGRFYLKQRAGRLFYDLWRLAALEGSPHSMCLGDPFV